MGLDAAQFKFPTDADFKSVAVVYVITAEGPKPITSVIEGDYAILGVSLIPPPNFQTATYLLPPGLSQWIVPVSTTDSILVENRGPGSVWFAFGGGTAFRELRNGEIYEIDLSTSAIVLQAEGTTVQVIVDYTHF